MSAARCKPGYIVLHVGHHRGQPPHTLRHAPQHVLHHRVHLAPRQDLRPRRTHKDSRARRLRISAPRINTSCGLPRGREGLIHLARKLDSAPGQAHAVSTLLGLRRVHGLVGVLVGCPAWSLYLPRKPSLCFVDSSGRGCCAGARRGCCPGCKAPASGSPVGTTSARTERVRATSGRLARSMLMVPAEQSVPRSSTTACPTTSGSNWPPWRTAAAG
jgi:hypothetical protein